MTMEITMAKISANEIQVTLTSEGGVSGWPLSRRGRRGRG